MVISELTRAVEKKIQNSDSPRLEAEYIVMAAAKMSRAEYLISRRAEVSEEVITEAANAAARRKNGEPLAYILGFTEFMGLSFSVNPSTLIPRPDTETLVELAIKSIGDAKVKVLDIGTGSGCIGISVAHFCKNADVTLLDISADALETAQKNAERNGADVKLLQCDILSEIPDGEYDIILSNPPYIESEIIPTLQTEVKDYEPLSALDGGADGLIFYRRIARIGKRLLKNNGLLMFEIGYNQAEAVTKIMADYENVRCEKDLCGNDRVVYGTKNEV